MPVLEERVDTLESILAQFIANTDRLENEMKDFKDEMREFKRVSEMDRKSLHEEMKEFKDEMREFKEWSKKNIESHDKTIENMNRQWGNLSNKLGTLVEDIFIPSIDITIEKYFGCSPDVIERKKIRKEGKVIIEIDILALCEEKKKAFIVEVKASPDYLENIESFIRLLEAAPNYLPEIRGYEVVKIYAGLSMKRETINRLTNLGIYAMVVKGDVLTIANFNELW